MPAGETKELDSITKEEAALLLRGLIRQSMRIQSQLLELADRLLIP